jgi:hypothetical protein
MTRFQDKRIESGNSKFNPFGSASQRGIDHGPTRTFVLIALALSGFSFVREKIGKIPAIKVKIRVVGDGGSEKFPSM